MENLNRAATSHKTNSLLRNGRDPVPEQKFNNNVRLVEVSSAIAPGEFVARVNGEILVASSRTPFTAAARVLVARGADTNSILVMRHVGSSINALVAKLCVAAGLTVKDPDRGRIHFAPYMAFPSSPVAASIRQFGL